VLFENCSSSAAPAAGSQFQGALIGSANCETGGGDNGLFTAQCTYQFSIYPDLSYLFSIQSLCASKENNDFALTRLTIKDTGGNTIYTTTLCRIMGGDDLQTLSTIQTMLTPRPANGTSMTIDCDTPSRGVAGVLKTFLR
jgi:hypothetical protein